MILIIDNFENRNITLNYKKKFILAGYDKNSDC